MSTEPRDEYTPTLAEVRDAAGPDGATAIEEAAFDSWLVAHDREVAAAALEAASSDWETRVRWEKPPVRGSVWLSRRAAAIREGRTDV